jgi:DNA repair exonuclease SbcCD ATPase subunit
MTIKKELTCQYCNEIYKHPITLPCGDNICKRHIKELTSNSSSNPFTCPLCNEEHANQSFKVNKLIQKLIESNMHKFEVDPRFKKVYESLKTTIEQLESILKDPENIIYEEMSELKRQVDLDREKLKIQVDALANDIIQQLESYEAKFRADYKANINLKHYNDLGECSKTQLAEYEQCLNLFSTTQKEFKEKSKQSEKIVTDLQPKIDQIKQELFSNILLSYEPMQDKIESFFGKLIIKVIQKNFSLFRNISKLILFFCTRTKKSF